MPTALPRITEPEPASPPTLAVHPATGPLGHGRSLVRRKLAPRRAAA